MDGVEQDAEMDEGHRRTRRAHNYEEEVQTIMRIRRRRLARSRASDFALGRGFVDDADIERPGDTHSIHQDDAEVPVSRDASGEVWPGPYTTAIDLLNNRSVAAAARKAKMVSRKTKINWEPRGAGSCLKKFPSLKELCLKKCAEKIDYLLENDSLIGLPAPLLGKLSQELCKQRKFNDCVLPYFTEEDTSILMLPDCSALSEENLLSAFETCKGPRLRRVHLRFCGRGMSDQVLITLTTGSTSIRELVLEGCYRLSDDGIIEAVNNLADLSVFELTSCPNLGKRSMEALVTKFGSTLKSLAIGSSPQLGAEELKILANFEKLESLKITENPNMTDDILEHILQNQSDGNLITLDLSSCSEITDAGVSTVAHKRRALKEIKLDCTKISDEGLSKLSERCTFLQSVSLRSCSNVTDLGCLHLIEKCKLTTLILNKLYCITDATICSLREHCANTLQELDISWCRAISDEALGVLIDSSRANLRTLTLRGCSQITGRLLSGHSNDRLEVRGHMLVEGIKAV
eukprot:Plantae.Rhodophyta-Purpureofilum_apyrenoidigerum.ctg21195.p1 GENE.Plantae.Rhodophyta-Purpureofilum_apyrenoidigerum.ctg21195~~Plantae.Rhodophyta-Purpureofilum_apyrenoidigerum.ctg21195.p1  ORF type:complete len:519 (-),score=78.34 Plantae.Rhodophyta-Purpureofilum_apyrenoidigerum.ctg21195:463-2019(-)